MGKKMGRKPASAVSMGLTGRKGSPGIIICDFHAVLIFAENIVHQILISSKEDLVDNNGYQPHFS